MPADKRTYITLHDGMPGNKKIRPLSDKAFRTIIEVWCWCSQERNDGRIDADNWEAFGDKRARDQLLAKGLVEVDGDGYVAHDYLEHQRSRAEIEELTLKKQNAGAKGGKAKAEALARAKQTGSEKVPESESDDLTTFNGDPDSSSDPVLDDSGIDPVLKSIVSSVRKSLGIELHPLVTSDVRDWIERRRGPRAKPLAYPSKYYADTIARSSAELSKFIYEKGLAS